MKKILLTIAISFFTLYNVQAQATTAENSSTGDSPFVKVETEAEFPGGAENWKKFLMKNLKGEVPIKNKAKSGSYTVIVQFIVDKDGTISNIVALTSYGYGMEKEVMRVIKKGPKWTPARQNGNIVKAYRKQPVTFVVE